MNLGFKRIMSGIIALVMMFSTLVISNVASVYAASSDFYLTADDFYDGGTPGTPGSKIAPTLSAAATASGITFPTSTNYYSVLGTRAGKEVTNTTTKTFTNEVRVGGSRTIKFTPASNGIVNAYVYVNDSNANSSTKKTVAIGATTTELTTGSTVIVATGAVSANTETSIVIAGDVCLLALEYISSSDTYTWALNTDSLVNVDKTKVSIDTAATGATNTLSYAGTDYVVKNAALAEGVDGVAKVDHAFTVTVTDDMFLPVTEGINVSVANAGGLDLVLSGANNGYKYTITLDENGGATGIALVQDTYTLSIAGGDLSFTSVVVDSTTTAINPVYTKDSVVALAHKYDLSDLTAGDITADTLIDGGAFKLDVTGTNKFTVEANSKEITIADGTTVTATNRLKFNGTGGLEKRAIVFTPAADGDIYFYALAGGSSSERKLTISDGTNELSSSAALSSSTFDAVKFTVEANKTYYVYATGNAVNVHYIASTFDLVAQTIDEATTETTTTEDTTTTEATTTTEPTTEAETSAPSDQLAEGTYSLKAGISIPGIDLGTSATSSNKISVKSDTYFEVTPGITGVIELTFTNKAPVFYEKDSSGNLTEIPSATTASPYKFPVAAGTTYRITGSDASSNTNITTLVLNDGTVAPTSFAITVTVHDNTTKAAITDATVVLLNSEGSEFVATSNGDGTYTCAGCYASDAINEIKVTKTGYKDYNVSISTVLAERNIDVALEELTSEVAFAGTVQDEAGNPLSGVDVAISLSNGTNDSMTTGADGKYSFSYEVSAVEAAGMTADISFSLLGYGNQTLGDVPANTTDTVVTLKLSSGGAGKYYEHNYTTDGDTDAEGFFTLNGVSADQTPVTVGESTFTKGVTLASDDGIDDYITFTTGENGGELHIVSTAKLNIYEGSSTTAIVGSPSGNLITVSNLLPNTTYRVQRRNNGVIYYVAFVEDSTEELEAYSLSGTVVDNSGNPISGVTVRTTSGASTTTGADGKFSFAGLTTAVTINAGGLTGYSTFTGTTSYKTTTSDIKITLTKSTNVNVVFSVEGTADAGSNISIKMSGESTTKNLKTIGTDVTYTNVAPGTTFVIESKASNVWKWADRTDNKNNISFHNGSASERYFTYTVPTNADTSVTYGIVYTTGTPQDDVADVYMAQGDNTNPVGFGQYGFGADKVNVCGGNDARQYVTYRFATPSLYDYSTAGFSDDEFNVIDKTGKPSVGNQYGILYKHQTETNYIEFTVAADVVNAAGAPVYAQVDRTNAVVITDVTGGASTAVTTTNIMNSTGKSVAKQQFEIVAGHTYRITASSTVSYVKSIRIVNPNNVFDTNETTLTAAQSVVNLGTYSEVQTNYPLIAEAFEAPANTSAQIFRIVGQVVLSDNDKQSIDAALSNITSVGYDVYTQADYNSVSTSTGNYYNESQPTVGGTKPTLVQTIVFEDVLNSSVAALSDTDGTNIEIGHLMEEATADDLYCQTFYAATENMVLVPWVQYSDGNKVYSVIPTTSTNNAKILTIQ